MNINLLKDLLAVPTTTYREQNMAAWLAQYVIHHVKGASVTVDAALNVYVSKGNAEFFPCVAAHTDTVHPWRKVTIVRSGTRLIGFDGKHRQVGIGADDKTGIFVCLNMLQRFKQIRALFFATEECGTVGAKKADPRFFEGIGYLIEFDCPSRNMLSYTCGGERLFLNYGDFIRQANPILLKHGTNLWQHHPFTDVMTVRRRFPISCLNLSSGYYNWHHADEFASLPDVELAIEMGTDLVGGLDNKRYSCPIDLETHDQNQPLVKVGFLHVPTAPP